MNCYSCQSEVNATMRHAININSCPFCGRNIFSPDEYDFRKSVQRILIKNGLEDENIMMGVVDDITTLLGEKFTREQETNLVEETVVQESRPEPPAKKEMQRRPKVASQDEIEAALNQETDASEEDSAPSRVLTPDPNKSRAAHPQTNADKISLAMREWEASQKIEDPVDDDFESDEDDGGLFTIEKPPVESAVAKGKNTAVAARMREIESKGGFKAKPVTRRDR